MDIRKPGNDKEIHEDEAISALCSELNAQGRQTRLVDRPDRRSNADLTVDATLEISGRKWAVDHCLVSRAPALPASMSVAEKFLETPLQDIANRWDVGLAVSYLPQPVPQNRKARRANQYYADLLARAEKAAETRCTDLGTDGMAQVHIVSSWEGEGSPPVYLMPFTNTTGSVFIGEEVMTGMREPLVKKIAHQFRPARNLGYNTMLLLDQIPRPGGNDTVWPASPVTVASVIETILADEKAHDVIDEIWLRQPPNGNEPPAVRQIYLSRT